MLQRVAACVRTRIVNILLQDVVRRLRNKSSDTFWSCAEQKTHCHILPPSSLRASPHGMRPFQRRRHSSWRRLLVGSGVRRRRDAPPAADTPRCDAARRSERSCRSSAVSSGAFHHQARPIPGNARFGRGVPPENYPSLTSRDHGVHLAVPRFHLCTHRTSHEVCASTWAAQHRHSAALLAEPPPPTSPLPLGRPFLVAAPLERPLYTSSLTTALGRLL